MSYVQIDTPLGGVEPLELMPNVSSQHHLDSLTVLTSYLHRVPKVLGPLSGLHILHT